jgi:branched-chain amino acid transport system substrate-binding protein
MKEYSGKRRKFMKGSLFRVLVAAALVVLMVAGVQAADQKQPIKIGAMFALSGPAAHIGTPTKLVAEMAVDQINKNGGIKGRPLELIIGDTQSDPAKAASIAKKFIYADKVVAIIGPTTTGSGMQVKKVVEKAGIPTFMCVGGDPVIMGGKFGPYTYVFKSPQRSSVAIKRLFTYLKEKKLTKVGMLYASDGFGKDGARWMEKLAPDYGITFVAKESFGPKDTDMTAQLTKIKNAKPQAIVCWTIGPAGAIVAKNEAQLGIKLPLFQCHGLPDPQYIKLAGKAAEGNRMPSTKLMVANELPDNDPQKKVILNFIKLYKDDYHYDKQFPINTHSGYAWDAIQIVADALRKAGTDPKALRTSIENTRGYVGVSGIYNLSPTDHNGLGPDSMVIIEVKDGKFQMAK